MKTHEIRREYLNPEIIPAAEPGPAFFRWYEVATFNVEEIAPALFGSLFDSRPADAVIRYRRRVVTPEERAALEQTGERSGVTAGPTLYRVIAYNGTPITTEEYPDRLAALRDAVTQREQPEPVED